MKDLQKYNALDTSLSMTLGIMRDLFGNDFLKWEDEIAKDIYGDILNVWDKVCEQERKLKEK